MSCAERKSSGRAANHGVPVEDGLSFPANKYDWLMVGQPKSLVA